jgi:Mannosyl-glycoprotein endo-beta-N-acetylglucosaminidase
MKRRFILLLAVLTFFTAISSQKALAYDQTSEQSADFAEPQTVASQAKQDNRAEILSAYLAQYNSPLADHADTFIKEADAYNLDWRMVAAISGVESGYGKAIPPYSYNAWGFGVYGSNVRRFTSWDDGITVVSTALRQEYMNARDATNAYQIGATYAASPTWATRVQGNMDAIEQFAENYSPKPALSISL